MNNNNQFFCQLIYKMPTSGQTIYRSANFNIDANSVAEAYQQALIQASALLLQHPELTAYNFVGIALLEFTNDCRNQIQHTSKVEIHPFSMIKEQTIKNYQASIIENLGYCA